MRWRIEVLGFPQIKSGVNPTYGLPLTPTLSPQAGRGRSEWTRLLHKLRRREAPQAPANLMRSPYRFDGARSRGTFHG